MSFAGNDVTVYTGTGPSEGDINENAGKKWLCYPNPEGWATVIERVKSGENPDGVNYSETQILWSEIVDQPDFKHSLAYHYYYGAHLDENDEWAYGNAEDYEDDYPTDEAADAAENGSAGEETAENAEASFE